MSVPKMSVNPTNGDDLTKRFHEVLPRIELVRKLCHTPSISFGVLHNGESFCHSTGYRDSEMIEQADPDTIYMLGSCSKMFTSAALGILVEEKQVHWQDRVQKILPGFCPIGDPRIGENADFIDLLRHSSGMSDVGRLCLGPNGSILVDEDDLLPLLNLMPTSNQKGQRFNREWAYNNAAYGIVSHAIEKTSGQRFDRFLKERILNPLGMSRTALTSMEIRSGENVATPCMAMESGRFSKLDFPDWPCEHVSPLLAAAGIRSSVKDMLKWCAAVLASEREEQSRGYTGSNSEVPKHANECWIPNNPLRQMNRIRRGYWTRPSDDPMTSKSATYCMGWVRMELPSAMLGSFSGNMLSREKDLQYHLKPELILGKSSKPMLAIGHSGGMPGSLATIWTFPETQSAVVVLTNGRGLGDASDFVAQILIQTLFDLQPVVDLIPWVKKETQLAQNYFRERILEPWTQYRRVDDSMRDSNVYPGHYHGFNGLFNLHITTDSLGNLSVIFNGRRSSESKLLPFRRDVYSFLIPEFDSWMSRGVGVSKFEQTLLDFDFDEVQGIVRGLHWLWNADEKREYFEKVT